MKTKICKKCRSCNEFKFIYEFYKNNTYKDNHFNCCKKCFKKRKKKYYQNNRKKIIKKVNEYRKENKEEYLKNNQEYYKKNGKQMNKNSKKNWYKKLPWEKTMHYIMNRCIYKSYNNYENYGAIGIKCLITKNELKQLWFRDKAYELNKASIDRKNPNGNYVFENCRYIELKENSKRSRYVRIKK